MIQIKYIDTLSAECSEYGQETLIQAAEDIASLANNNIMASNQGDYDDEALAALGRSKTAEATLVLLKNAFTICIYDDDRLVACGMVVKSDGLFYAKSLHVLKAYRGRGLAQLICDEREQFIRGMGGTEVYIESLKFEHTVNFHKMRGFTEAVSHKTLKNTIFMKKALV